MVQKFFKETKRRPFCIISIMEAEYLEFNEEDLKYLRYAVSMLENPGLLIKIVNKIGTPIEAVMKKLPQGTSNIVNKAVDKSLKKAAEFALNTLQNGGKISAPNETGHKIMVAFSGAAGGLFGIPGIVADLPISTVIMLRSIMEIARSLGEDLSSPESIAECLSVFAMGGRSGSDDGAETGYYAVRAALSMSVRNAETYLAKHGVEKITEKSSPYLLRLIATVAERFGVTVSEKAMAQAVPIIGAAGGAAINVVFINHFQDMARGHFIIRCLERKYGKQAVKDKYDEILKRK